jgi:signal transduction histidine kinase
VNEVIEPEIDGTIHQQRELKHSALQQAREKSHTTHAGAWLLLLGGLGSIGGLVGGYSLARRFQKEMMELSVPIHNAAGSLSAIVGPIQLAGSTGIEQLETSLQGIAQQVAAVVERLQTAERENVRKDQMAALGQLAAGLAHELRNPLTAIKTLIEAAKNQQGNAMLEGRDLEVIEEEITRLNKTLQAFLDYARPPKLVKTTVDLNDLVGKTEKLLIAQAQQRSIQMKLELSRQPVALQADPEQLRQVLLNLILNAFDAVGTHGTVLLQTESTPSSVILKVKDSGPGISDALRAKLFEPFVSSKAAGTGLGLTICKRIVEEHGGTITAENVPIGGACFTVTLPI